MLKKIAIIGTAGLPARYGGFESLAENLSRYLGTAFDMTVYCSSKLYQSRLKEYNKARLKYINLNANGVQSIPYDILSVFHALCYADTLLILGVSGCIVLPFVKLFSRKTLIVNIDGMEWKRAKWGRAAKWFLKYSEKLAVKNADVVITDNKVIQQYVWETYQIKSELIAYGGDHTRNLELTQDLNKQYPFLKDPYAFKVCRIEPENNVSMILEAFKEFGDMNLVMIGNWDNSAYGRQLKLKYGKGTNMYLIDPIYNQNTLDQIRSNCGVYVHGHSAGGTNPSLVEAMYLGLPILAYEVNYNMETTANKAKYFSNCTELIALLDSSQEKDLKDLAANMKQLAKERYTWQHICDQYAALLKIS